MPELPEVEVVRRGLAAHLDGEQIVGVEVRHPRAVRRHLAGEADFEATVAGRTFAAARRRGKYLWIPFTDGDSLLVHLGMSGQVRVYGGPEVTVLGDDAADPDSITAGAGGPIHPVTEKHTRVLFTLASGRLVRFVDQRTFGGLQLSHGGAELPPEIAHIGRDPFDPDFDETAVIAAYRKRHSEVKRALLDQQIMSGVGNIYADETLWRCRLHPERACTGVSVAKWREVIDTAHDVMDAALAVGGTSFDSLYVNVNGESGYFERSLEVYGREGLPCRRCGGPIRREAFMNRSSHFCPRCQGKR